MRWDGDFIQASVLDHGGGRRGLSTRWRRDGVAIDVTMGVLRACTMDRSPISLGDTSGNGKRLRDASTSDVTAFRACGRCIFLP